MALGALSGVRPAVNSVIAPVAGLMRPIRPGSARSVNQRLPSAPAAMSVGWLLKSAMGNSVMAPSV